MRERHPLTPCADSHTDGKKEGPQASACLAGSDGAAAADFFLGLGPRAGRPPLGASSSALPFASSAAGLAFSGSCGNRQHISHARCQPLALKSFTRDVGVSSSCGIPPNAKTAFEYHMEAGQP